MRFDQLNCFYKVAMYNSFTKAATELYLTQPTVSKMIAALERELKQPLFIRKKNGFELTEFGKKVYADSGVILELVEEWYAAAASEDKLEEVHLQSTSTMCNFLSAYFLTKFQEKYPNISLMLHDARSGEIIKSMDSFDYNIGIIPLRPENKDVIAEVKHIIDYRGWCEKILLRDEKALYINAENELAKRERLYSTDLKSLSLCTYSDSNDENRKYFGKYFHYDSKYFRHSKSQIFALIKENKACASIFPRFTTNWGEELVISGVIVGRRIEDIDMGSADFHLIHKPRQELSRSEKIVVSELEKYFMGLSAKNDNVKSQ